MRTTQNSERHRTEQVRCSLPGLFRGRGSTSTERRSPDGCRPFAEPF